MNTNALKQFATSARRQLMAQVSTRMEQVLTTDSAILREKQVIINQLRAEIAKKGKKELIEEAAYTWFNRLCALRYMDVNNFTQLGIVSPAAGFTQPEILQQAKQGLFDPDWQLDRKRVLGLLNGSISSPDADQEAYRLLLVAACNSYSREMDFLFTAIEDVTELLMPDDLLSNQSVLQGVRDTLTAEVCQDVEVIGWLYQFYISEKKDQVMAAKGAVKAQDIPAVTQLFTPDWIVRYMVQNSLGRLWLLNHPNSSIRERMEYYISPVEPESDFLRVGSPEELKLLDPACGSGHILTYAFDLLYDIYEEQGYDAVGIPRLILQKNLYGIEIDKRAAMLASFALVMKARAKDKRFFSRAVKPNILEMGNVTFEPHEVKDYMDRVGRDLYTQDIWEGLQQFENAATFGSLIRPAIKDVPTLRERMQAAGVFDDLFLNRTNEKLLKVLEMSEYLSPRYQVVVANPPYFSKGMDAEYKQFAQDNYPDSKADALSMFMERNLCLARKGGYVAMITLMSWMFLGSFEKLREKLLEQNTILSMAHLGTRAFDTIGGEVVATTMFILKNIHTGNYSGEYFRLLEGNSENEKATLLQEAIKNPYCGWFFIVSSEKFKKIPGATIAYWLNSRLFEAFEKNDDLSRFGEFKHGMSTSDNSRFLRFWYEVDFDRINFSCKDKEETFTEKIRWYPYLKGGSFRKWYGNQEYVVNWQNDGQEIKEISNYKYPYLKGNLDFVLGGQKFFFQPGYSWSAVSTLTFGVRKFHRGFIFDTGGQCFFPRNDKYGMLIFGLLNSKVTNIFLEAINPTINYGSGSISKIPMNSLLDRESQTAIVSNIVSIVDKTVLDWDSYEISWDYTAQILLKDETFPISLSVSDRYFGISSSWEKTIHDCRFLEEENNRVFIESYGIQDELAPEVPIEEITLTCNPHYRYKGDYTEEQRETRLLEDTMKEFLSYAVGCMFGRYSLDKPGLILANQGETLHDYLKIIGKEPIFRPTETNVIPILDGDWFIDDVVSRFKEFLKVTFGEPNYEENLSFIESALGKNLRRYFLADFFKDHVRTYKKRPIYWLFSSPRGSFNALIYMHRYQPDTVSVVLNQYLREYREKLDAQRQYQLNLSTSPASTPREKTEALKEIETLARIQAELKDYEDNVLFPLAGQRVSIDLDDGVVVNYAKFGNALRKI